MVELAEWAVFAVLILIGFLLIYTLVVSGWLPNILGKSGQLLVNP